MRSDERWQLAIFGRDDQVEPDGQGGTGLAELRGQESQPEGQGRAEGPAHGRVLELVLPRAVRCCALFEWTLDSQAVDTSSVN